MNYIGRPRTSSMVKSSDSGEQTVVNTNMYENLGYKVGFCILALLLVRYSLTYIIIIYNLWQMYNTMECLKNPPKKRVDVIRLYKQYLVYWMLIVLLEICEYIFGFIVYWLPLYIEVKMITLLSFLFKNDNGEVVCVILFDHVVVYVTETYGDTIREYNTLLKSYIGEWTTIPQKMGTMVSGGFVSGWWESARGQVGGWMNMLGLSRNSGAGNRTAVNKKWE